MRMTQDISHYHLQTKFAKVMFLHMSVCPQWGWHPSMPCRWYLSMPCRSPGGVSRPRPRGVSRPTSGGGVSLHALRQTPPPPWMATATGGMHPTGMHSCYWLQRSCGQGNIFTPVCHSFCSQGRGSASVHAGIPPPPPGAHPREQTPPRRTHPSGKQTPAYGLPAAGTHPSGMHSCFVMFLRS